MSWLIESFESETILEKEEQYYPLEEGWIFKSQEGKDFQIEVKAKCKELNKKYGATFKQRLVSNLKQPYNKQQLNEMFSFMKSKLKPFWRGTIWIVTGDVNDCYVSTWGMKKDKLYYAKFHMTGSSIAIFALKEVDINEGLIPKDVIEYTLKTIPQSVDNIGFTKRMIHLGAFTGPECKKIIEFAQSKHKDISVKEVMGNVVFS